LEKKEGKKKKRSTEPHGQASGETFSLTVEPNWGPPLRYWIRNSIGYPFSLWGTISRSLKVKAADPTIKIKRNGRIRSQKGEKEKMISNKLNYFNSQFSETTVSVVAARIWSRLKISGLGNGNGTFLSNISLGIAKAWKHLSALCN